MKNICIRQEHFAVLFLFIIFSIFILNSKNIIAVKLPKEKMSNLSIFDGNNF